MFNSDDPGDEFYISFYVCEFYENMQDEAAKWWLIDFN